MIKHLVGIALLLLCSFGVRAADWQWEIFSPMSNELPPTRGVAVDELGYVHAQAFSRAPAGRRIVWAHRYTLTAHGQLPWPWGVSQADRISDCGVYARAGQRADCVRTSGPGGEDTHIEMRSGDNGALLWRSALPTGATLVDASLPRPGEALVLGRMDTPAGARLGVFRAYSSTPAATLSIAPACPRAGQTVSLMRARMPKHIQERIRVVSICRDGLGVSEAIVDEFDPVALRWATLATASAPFGAAIAHAAINADGDAFVVIERQGGGRELLVSGVYGDAWTPLPLPGDGAILALLANDRAVAVVLDSPIPSAAGADRVIWFDPQGGPPPQPVPYPAMANIAPARFALSSEGALLLAGRDAASLNGDRLWLANRHGAFAPIGALPLAANETTDGTTYLIGGPDNTATVARTVARSDGAGGMQIGIRVNRYDLPR